MTAVCVPLRADCVPLHACPPAGQEREKFQITSLLFNPMLLMMVVPFLLMFVMPKMLPEDMAKEMERAQEQMGANPVDAMKKARACVCVCANACVCCAQSRFGLGCFDALPRDPIVLS